jgi:histidinol-phosphatase (PHP family)
LTDRIIRANFHTHSNYCDGSGDLEDYVKHAIQKGFQAIGFSSHAPTPFVNQWAIKNELLVSDYLRSIDLLKIKYRGQIEVYKGLEIDYLRSPKKPIFVNYSLDYRIGSVHYISDPSAKKYYAIDGSKDEFEILLKREFHGNVFKLVEEYYTSIIKMVKSYQPEIIGHLDLIVKNNKSNEYFCEQDQWYVNLIVKVFDAIKESNSMVELNTGCLKRYNLPRFFPSEQILFECRRNNIPVIVNSDAHCVEDLDAQFDEAFSLLKDIGYSEHYILLNGKWCASKL